MYIFQWLVDLMVGLNIIIMLILVLLYYVVICELLIGRSQICLGEIRREIEFSLEGNSLDECILEIFIKGNSFKLCDVYNIFSCLFKML